MKNLKNMSKRALALFLTLMMCLSIVNLTAFAEEADGANAGPAASDTTDLVVVDTEQTPDESGTPGGESDKSSDESDKSSDESDKSNGESDKSPDESGTPGDESDKSSDESGTPGDESDKSNGESGESGDESGESGDESDKSNDESDKSNDESDKSNGESDKSTDESDKSNGESGESGDESDKSNDESDKSGGESGESNGESDKPTDESGESDKNSEDPEKADKDSEEPAPDCNCETKCTEDDVNLDCPVCGAEDADLNDCKGKDEEPEEEEVSAVQKFLDAVQTIMDLQDANADAEEVLAALDEANAAYDALSEEEKADETVAAMYEALKTFEEAMTLAEADNEVATFSELKAAIEAAESTPTTITITKSFDITGYPQIKQEQNITLTAGDGVVLGRSDAAKGSLWIYGTLTLENIVLDGRNVPSSYALVYIAGTGKVTMTEGSVVQNAYNDYSSKQYGGGVYNAGEFTMETGSTIVGNTAKSYGGGVYNSGTFTMNGGTISGNKNPTWYGGGVYNKGTFTVSGGEISNNEATNTTYGLGGGVYSSTGITMKDTTVSGNVNGGVYTDATVGTGAVTLESLTVTGNTGSQPALRIGVVDGALVNGCTISENTVVGAAVEITGRGPTVSDNADATAALNSAVKELKNCSITNNTCTSTDYASQKAAVALGSCGTKTVSGCTITGNSAYYGGLYNQTSNAPTTICGGTLIANNTGEMCGGLATLTSSNDIAAVTVIDGAVIKDNEGGSVGGVQVGGNFELKSGAIYNNDAKNNPKAKDLNKYNAKAKCTLIKASEMTDPQNPDFFSTNNYIWSDGVARWEDLSFTNSKEPFSLTAAPKEDFFVNSVYLNGSTGSDKNDGLTLGTPVKTFERALAVLQGCDRNEAGKLPEICVTGTLTSTGTETWDGGEGAEVTLVRYPTFRNALIDVTGGQLTLKNITLDGAYELCAATSSAPLIKLSGGELVLDTGTTLRNNVRTGGNKYEGGGGVYANGGTLTMKDGSVIENNYAHNGGGVSLMQNKPVFNMEGGTICNNRTSLNKKYSMSDDTYQTSGGGVFIAYDAVMNMSGGTISGNTAYSGAGISLGGPENSSFINDGRKDYHPTFNMSGGKIENNTAYSNGGAMFVQMNCTATLDARNSGKEILIQNNTIQGYGYGANYGGGGIYVNGGKDRSYKNGTLQLYDVEITGNTAGNSMGQGEGAAIAACPTSDTRIYVTDGGVIHDNNGIDLYLCSALVPGVDYGTAQLILSSYMLGGGAYHWSDREGNELPLNGGFVQVINTVFYAKTETTGEDVTGVSKCTTHITGNTSAGRGGAIGSNGNVIIGTAPTENDTTSIKVTVDKVWKDGDDSESRPEFIDVRIIAIKQNGTEIDQGFIRISYDKFKSENNWTASYDGLPRLDEDGNPFRYTIREVNVIGYNGEITNCVVVKKDESGDIPEFDVSPKHDEETNSYDVKISKDLREADSTITFEVTTESDEVKGKSYNVVLENCEATAQTITFDENGKATIEVRPTEGARALSVTIQGLPASEYKVSDGKKEQSVDVGENAQDGTIGEINFELTNTPAGYLTIEKKVVGGGDAALEKVYKFSIVGPESVNGKYSSEYSNGNTGEVEFTDGKATVEITGAGRVTIKLPMGTYKVTEDGESAEIKDYSWSGGDGGEAVLEKVADEKTVTITNTYTPDPGKLTIQKKVDGGGSAAANKVYTFTVTGPNGYKTTVAIKGAGSVTIENLAPGEYNVTEADASISGYRWSVNTNPSPVTVKSNDTATVTVTNTYTDIPEGPGPDPTPTPTPTPDPDPDPTPTPDIPDDPPPKTEPDPDPDPTPTPTPSVDIPDDPTPKTEPDPDVPVDVPDPNVPLVPPEITVPWEPVPLLPSVPVVDIPQEDVPLADVPQTGDISLVWYAVLVLSACGLAVLSLRKREDEEK